VLAICPAVRCMRPTVGADLARVLGAALLCLTNAHSGGVSGWSSSISVHNEIVRRRPDLARVLAGPWFFDRKGEVPEGKKGYFELPVFNYYQVCMCCLLDYSTSLKTHPGVRPPPVGVLMRS
jgi:hypothetical protein